MKKAQDLTRVLISMPEGFLQQVDKMAEEENRSRSELVREALRRYLRTAGGQSRRRRMRCIEKDSA